MYVDETGHSAKEPLAVVAGLILDPDQQWRALADRLEEIRQDVPETFRDGYIFHAKDLFGGGKYRGEWEQAASRKILKRIAAIPRELNLTSVTLCAASMPTMALLTI